MNGLAESFYASPKILQHTQDLTAHPRSYSTPKILQHSQDLTAHPRSYSIPKILQHTAHPRSYSTAKILRQHTQDLTVYPRSYSTPKILQHHPKYQFFLHILQATKSKTTSHNSYLLVILDTNTKTTCIQHA